MPNLSDDDSNGIHPNPNPLPAGSSPAGGSGGGPPGPPEDSEEDEAPDPQRPRGARGEETFRGEDEHISAPSDLGGMTYVCEDCKALHRKDERAVHSSMARPKFPACCANGLAATPYISDPPEPLRTWAAGATPAARKMLGHVWMLNHATALTSMRARAPPALPGSSNLQPSVRLDGQLTHMAGPLLASGAHEASFLQACFLDSTENDERLAAVCRAMATGRSAGGGRGLWRLLVAQLTAEERYLLGGLQQLDAMLKDKKALVRIFLTARERVAEVEAAADGAPIPSLRIVISADARPDGGHVRVYNNATSAEAAVVLPMSELEVAPEDAGNARSRELILQVRAPAGAGAAGAQPEPILRKSRLANFLSRRSTPRSSRLARTAGIPR